MKRDLRKLKLAYQKYTTKMDILQSLQDCEDLIKKSKKSSSFAHEIEVNGNKFEYLDENRIGDHLCFYSDLGKTFSHFPKFKILHSLEDTISQIICSGRNPRLQS